MKAKWPPPEWKKVRGHGATGLRPLRPDKTGLMTMVNMRHDEKKKGGKIKETWEEVRGKKKGKGENPR